MKTRRWFTGILVVFLLCLSFFILYMLSTAVGSPVFLYRAIVWNLSDVKDYQKFPERAIENASPVFEFKQNLKPELFAQVEYDDHGVTRQSSLDELLKATGTTSFIVIQDDTILYEKYFNGYTRDSIVTSFSTAKSFDSAMIGIAIDEGLIGSVDDPVIQYIPELTGRGLDGLTIKHLLTMSSGIKYLEGDKFPFLLSYQSDDAKTYYFPDLRKLALTVKPGDEPLGANFHYNNYHPLLEGLILERVTSMPVAKWLQEMLWKPLGMEFPASWSLDSKSSGFEKMESGINGRAIDFAKFGRLFLNKGNWDGKQVISEKWVTESTSPDPADNRAWVSYPAYKEMGGYYKYHWWGLTNLEGHYDFMAQGHLWQVIYVCPPKKLVIVRYGWETETNINWPFFLQRLEEKLN